MSDPLWFWELSISGKIIFILFVTIGYFGLNLHFKIDMTKKTELLKHKTKDVKYLLNR